MISAGWPSDGWPGPIFDLHRWRGRRRGDLSPKYRELRALRPRAQRAARGGTIDMSVTVMGQKARDCRSIVLRPRCNACSTIPANARLPLQRRNTARCSAYPRSAQQAWRSSARRTTRHRFINSIFHPGPRPQPRDDATRETSWCRRYVTDRGQHHRRQPGTRSAHRVFHSVQADAWRDVPVCDQADVGHSTMSAMRVFKAAAARSARRHQRGAVSIGKYFTRCWIHP